MAEYSSYEPKVVEVLGEVIESFVFSFPDALRFVSLEALERHGIANLHPKRYYPAQPFLDTMKDVEEHLGHFWMTRVGQLIALRVSLPPDWDSLEASLRGLDGAYHTKYRGGEIGHWQFIPGGEVVEGVRRCTMISSNHYSCAFDRGVLEGFAERFRPDGVTDVLVRHDDSQPCRRNGADSCTYVITWG